MASAEESNTNVGVLWICRWLTSRDHFQQSPERRVHGLALPPEEVAGPSGPTAEESAEVDGPNHRNLLFPRPSDL